VEKIHMTINGFNRPFGDPVQGFLQVSPESVELFVHRFLECLLCLQTIELRDWAGPVACEFDPTPSPEYNFQYLYQSKGEYN
jgi:hypothetical protein